MAKKKSHSKASKKSTSKRTHKPKARKVQSDREIAIDFASAVHKKFDTLVKATVLFGSQAKHTARSNSDIDIVIIADDVSVNWDLELISWYRDELSKIIAAQENTRELHINTIKLSTWWNDLMHGDPVVINILRYGETLIDIGGFFKPQKALLLQGKIHSTPEAVYEALQRAPAHLARSKMAEMGAIEGIYWCFVDSAQAALMTLGKLPPSPEHVTTMLKEDFVDAKLLKLEYIAWYRDIYAMHKAVNHGKLVEIKGHQIDVWQERAEAFLKRMTEIIDTLIDAKTK